MDLWFGGRHGLTYDEQITEVMRTLREDYSVTTTYIIASKRTNSISDFRLIDTERPQKRLCIASERDMCNKGHHQFDLGHHTKNGECILSSSARAFIIIIHFFCISARRCGGWNLSHMDRDRGKLMGGCHCARAGTGRFDSNFASALFARRRKTKL